MAISFWGGKARFSPSLFKSLFAKRSSQAANSAVPINIWTILLPIGEKGGKKKVWRIPKATVLNAYLLRRLTRWTSRHGGVKHSSRSAKLNASVDESPLFFGLVMLSDLTGVKRQVQRTRRSKMVAKIWDESPAATTPSKTKSAVPRRDSRVRTLWLLFGFSGWSRNRTNLLLPSRSSFSKLLQLWDELSDGSSSNS